MKNSLLLLFTTCCIASQAQFDSNETVIASALNNFQTLKVGDLDGDGDNDIVMAINQNADLAWIENLDGQGNFGSPIAIVQNLGSSNFDVGDADDDGDLDILFEDRPNAQLKVALNNGNGAFTITVIDPTYTLQASSVSFLNISGSAVNDVVVSTSYPHPNVGVHWYEYTPTQWTSPDSNFVSGGNPTALNPKSADMDLDGIDDLVLSHTWGGWFTINRRQSHHTPIWDSPIQINGPNSLQDYQLIDIDDDGDMDIASRVIGNLIWYENQAAQGGWPNFTQHIFLEESIDLSVQSGVFAELGCGVGAEAVWSDANFIPSNDIPIRWSGYSDDINEFQAYDSIAGLLERAYILDIADLTSDGKPDLIMGRGDSLFFYPNDLPAAAPTQVTHPTQNTVAINTSFPLNSGIPGGGSYSGQNVSGNVFQSPYAGTYNVLYEREEGTGCRSSVGFDIDVTEDDTPGSTNTAFGPGGVINVLENNPLIDALALCDGKYLTLHETSQNSCQLLRRNADLSIDWTWAGGGLAIPFRGTKLEHDGMGRYVVAHTGGFTMVLANGQVDTDFANNGLLSGSGPFTVRNGSILTAGGDVRKYDANGLLVSSFGWSGVFVEPTIFDPTGTTYFSYPHARELPDGRIFLWTRRFFQPNTATPAQVATFVKVYSADMSTDTILSFQSTDASSARIPQNFSVIGNDHIIYAYNPIPAIAVQFGAYRISDLTALPTGNPWMFPGFTHANADVNNDGQVLITGVASSMQTILRTTATDASLDPTWGTNGGVQKGYQEAGHVFCQDDGTVQVLTWQNDTLYANSYYDTQTQAPALSAQWLTSNPGHVCPADAPFQIQATSSSGMGAFVPKFGLQPTGSSGGVFSALVDPALLSTDFFTVEFEAFDDEGCSELIAMTFRHNNYNQGPLSLQYVYSNIPQYDSFDCVVSNTFSAPPCAIPGESVKSLYFKFQPTQTEHVVHIEELTGDIDYLSINPFNNSQCYSNIASGVGYPFNVVNNSLQDIVVHTTGTGPVSFRITVTDSSGFSVPIELNALLEGPYDSNTGLMNNDLTQLPSFPTTEPFTSLGFTHLGSGGETMDPALLNVTGPEAIVDWVFINVRPKNDNATVVYTKVGLITREGNIIEPDGSALRFDNLAPDLYLIGLQHRNHLGVVSAFLVDTEQQFPRINFRDGWTPAFGMEGLKNINGKFAMWAGDVNSNGDVKYTGAANDRDPILVNIGGSIPTNTATGVYATEDVNMDGVVKYTGAANDRDPILVNIGGNSPTNTRTEQAP